jgi:chemotaxis protein CheD
VYQHFHNKFQRTVSIIHPGEYYATREHTIISTVLGSCVAVALYDPKNRFAGLNHFMLPGRLGSNNLAGSDTGKYGIFAMEFLVNEMIKLGANKGDLVAKVFGGGHVLNRTVDNGGSIPSSNVTFAFEYLKTEGIKVQTSDVGGTIARKIFLEPETFKVWLKRITGKLIVDVEQEEKEYLEKLKKPAKPAEEVTFF